MARRRSIRIRIRMDSISFSCAMRARRGPHIMMKVEQKTHSKFETSEDDSTSVNTTSDTAREP